MKLLLINSSANNLEQSYSRRLTQYFTEKWVGKFPNTSILERDVAAHPLPHLTKEILDAIRTTLPTESLTSGVETRLLSNALIQEIKEAHIIVFGVPMYNFSIPSTLKTYIDYVVRKGETVGYDPVKKRSVGLVHGKEVIVITIGGGLYQNTAMDFQGPYLKAVFSYIGLDEKLHFIQCHGTLYPPEVAQKAFMQAQEAIREYIEKANPIPE